MSAVLLYATRFMSVRPPPSVVVSGMNALSGISWKTAMRAAMP